MWWSAPNNITAVQLQRLSATRLRPAMWVTNRQRHQMLTALLVRSVRPVSITARRGQQPVRTAVPVHIWAQRVLRIQALA